MFSDFNSDVIDRLHYENRLRSSSRSGASGNSSPIDIDLFGIMGTVLRESPFLAVGLGCLSVLKNNTSIDFVVVFLVAVAVGSASRFFVSKLVRKSFKSESRFYRVVSFLLLSLVPFYLSYGALSSFISLDSVMSGVLVFGGSFFIAAVVESFSFEALS